MATGDQAPEQLIRRWLDEHGPATVGMGALAQSWELESLEDADRRAIAGALREAGVAVDPPLESAEGTDRLSLRVAEAAGAAASHPVGLTPPIGVKPTEKSEPAFPAPATGDSSPDTETARAPYHSEARRAEPANRSRSDTEPGPGLALAMRLVPIALALMVFGSLGPWARDVFVTDYGIDRSGYAILAITLVAGLLLALHARRGRRSLLPLAAALLATAALVILAADFRELVDDGLVSPAWGLYLAFAGSAALVALSMALLTDRR